MTKPTKPRAKVRKPRPWHLWSGSEPTAAIVEKYGDLQVDVSDGAGNTFLGFTTPKVSQGRAKVRKPRDLLRHDGSLRARVIGRIAWVSSVPLECEDVPRLTAWLTHAHAYLEAKEKGGG